MPDFTVKNQLTGERIPVNWEANGDDWYAASWDGQDVTLNSDRKSYIGHDVLLHELGHALGFQHDDAGDSDTASVMDYDFPDKDLDTPIHDVTLEIARSFEGYRVIEWSTKDIIYLMSEYNAGWMDTQHILWCMSKYNSDKLLPQVYYAKNWDNFGLGHSWEQQFDILGPNRGHFYGSTVEQSVGGWRATNDCSECSPN